MKVPSILQGQSLARLLQGAAAGAAIAMVVGFNWGGWVTGGSVNKLVMVASEKAVINALAPGCAANFRLLADTAPRIELLKANLGSGWKMRDAFPPAMIKLPGKDNVDSDLALACADIILAPSKSAAVKQ